MGTGVDQSAECDETAACRWVSEMNHGVVMFQRRDMPESRIWNMAMGHGKFIAVYTARSTERSADGSASQVWTSALVPSTGGPLRYPPLPEPAEHGTDYARFEPAYDDEFFRMCQWCSGTPFPTVVLPATAGDEQAMRLLGELDSIQGDALLYMYERFYVVPRHNLRKPEKCGIRLSTLMMSIHPSDGWAYFLGFFRRGDGVVVFLSDDESDVEGLFEPTDAARPIIRQADWLHHHGVIEKW
jgi:hypothetical protein